MIDERLKILVNGNGKLIPSRTNILYLKKHNLYDIINKYFDDSYSLIEKIYCLINDIYVRKKCKCGNEIKFNYGYANFCCKKCASNDKDVLRKNKEGVSKALKKAYQKRGDEIKKKRNKTLYEKYNLQVNSPFEIPEIQQKAKITTKKRYGVDNVFYLKKFRSDGKFESQKKSIKDNKFKGYDIKYIEKNKILIKDYCDIHGDVEMDCINFYNRTFRNRRGIKCPLCNPINSFSSLEIEMDNILKQLKILNYQKNTQKIINPYELDFYFPEHKIAIELNGIYWHSEIHKDKNYHKMKTDLCVQKGIRLIHIWEDDFYDKREIVISVLKYLFNKIERKIYARKCKIKNIDSKTYRNFLKEYHMQGIINSSIKYGLFFENELISIMGIGKTRIPLGTKDKEGIFELHRFCSKNNLVVVGGASKLLSFFEKNNEYKKIISYAKRDYSNGNLYDKIGFKLDKICDPGYYWIINDKRKHRFNYRKNMIINESNKHLTATEIMHNKGYYRCYDSGNFKFLKTKFINK